MVYFVVFPARCNAKSIDTMRLLPYPRQSRSGGALQALAQGHDRHPMAVILKALGRQPACAKLLPASPSLRSTHVARLSAETARLSAVAEVTLVVDHIKQCISIIGAQ